MISQKQLDKLGIKYIPEAKRYVGPNKKFISFKEVLRRVEELKDEESDAVPVQDESQLTAVQEQLAPVAERIDDVDEVQLAPTDEPFVESVSDAESVDGEDGIAETETDTVLRNILFTLVQINDSFERIIPAITEAAEPRMVDFIRDERSFSARPFDKQQMEDEKKKKALKTRAIVSLFISSLPIIIKIVTDTYNEVMSIYEKNKDNISNFLQPVFEFIFEKVPKFFTEDIPEFFDKYTPQIIKDKFAWLSEKFKGFSLTVQKLASWLKIQAGKLLVVFGNSLPDFIGVGDTIAKFGQDMIDNAQESMEGIDEEEKQLKREKALIEAGEELAERKVESRPDYYKDVEKVEYDREKNWVVITYSTVTGDEKDFLSPEKLPGFIEEEQGEIKADSVPVPPPTTAPSSSGGMGTPVPPPTTAPPSGEGVGDSAPLQTGITAPPAQTPETFIPSQPTKTSTSSEQKSQPPVIVNSAVPQQIQEKTINISDVPDPTFSYGPLSDQLFYFRTS